MADTRSESFSGQRVRKCILCGAKRLCEWSESDNGPICFHGIECAMRQTVRPSNRWPIPKEARRGQ